MELKTPVTERRKQTRSKIYHHIYKQSSFCSKQTVSRDMGLSLPTVYQNLDELIDADLIGYTGTDISSGGRKAKGIDIVSDARISIGVSITVDAIHIVAVDLRLKEICYASSEYVGQVSFENISSFLSKKIESFINNNQIDRKKLLGIGIAVPGILSSDGLSIISAPTLGIRNIKLDSICKAIPYPVYIQNDATCAGQAEWFVRSQSENASVGSTMAYLSLEIGVGGALLINGQVQYGDNYRSSEFGHMVVEPNGLPCKCGKKGCLEAYCSTRRISDDLNMSLGTFFENVEKGKKKYSDIWDDYLYHLAIGICNINIALDCDVVIGGVLSEYLDPYLPKLLEYIDRFSIPGSRADYIHLSLLKGHCIPLGASLHYIEDFIDSI